MHRTKIMWTFRNGNVFVLLFWTIYGPAIVNATPPQTVLPIGGGGAGDSTAAAATINQPCDRTRRVFTEPYGEISDGPVGSNYTQVCVIGKRRIFWGLLLNKN